MILADLAKLVPSAGTIEPTHWWQGASGHWYIHTIYPIHAIPDFIRTCNYIFARPRYGGTREPLYIGESGEFDQRLDRHEKLGAALRLGATEVHIHYLAQSRQERLHIETDLRNSHATPLNAQPTAAQTFLPLPVPSYPLRSLADLLLHSAPTSPLINRPLETFGFQGPLLKASPKMRSRSAWNDRMTHWERPASDSEEQQINRAADMVRAALSNNRWLKDERITISPQGSYHNNTNVRLEADMDIRAVHPSIRLEYASNVAVDSARTVLGIYDTGRTYTDVAQEMRRQILSELGEKFGTSNVDGSGNKAIRLKKQPGSRADVDIASAFKLYWVEWNNYASQYHVEEGVAILGKDGSWTYNFPEQHHRNGVTKRTRTKHRFKKNVRVLKRLRDELVDNYQLAPRQVPSFLIECLTYAVEDEYFLVETDDRYDRALRILSRMDDLLCNTNWVKNAMEINELKYLFWPGQAWSVDDARAFIQAARCRIGA